MLRNSAFQILLLLVLPAIAAPQDSHPNVVRDSVKGAMVHGSGNTEWERVIGKVKVLDARTVEFADGTRIELNIHSPDLNQWAMDGEMFYPCGEEAAEFLRKLIDGRRVTVFRNGDGPAMAYIGSIGIEYTMVVNGWALADHSSLHASEIIARENKRGLWRGKFVVPDDWREGKRLPGEEVAAKSPRAQTACQDDPKAILGRWDSLDRHVAMGSLFQPVHGVRKREAVVAFQKDGERLMGFAIMADHKAITNQERWKDGLTELRNVRFESNQLSFEFPIGEWFETKAPIAVADKRIANQGTIRVDARIQGDRLIGRWRMFLADETEVFRGEWEAKRTTEEKEKP